MKVFATALLLLAALPAQAAAPVAGTPFERHLITDPSGRAITYYLSHPKAARAPLLLMIQGSGCSKAISEGFGKPSSTVFNLLPFAQEGQFVAMVVEKPFAGEASGTMGQGATGCSAAFNADFTAASWLAAIQASLADARKSAWIDPARMLVLGGSEGAVMASLLAAADPAITDVAVLGGSGTTQAYDFIVSAYLHCFDVPACLAQVDQQLQEIAARPDSTTDFAWGHPYKRWSSFFKVDPGEALVRSRARVYLAFGTADRSVPALSQEIMVAKMLGAGRDVTVRRIPDAGHSLARPGPNEFDDVDREYRAVLDWFWRAEKRQP